MKDHGLAADQEQHQAAADAAERDASKPKPVYSLIGSIFAQAEAWKAMRLTVLAEQCPKCAEPDGEIARPCKFRDDQACRHREIFKHWAKYEYRKRNLLAGKVPHDFHSKILRNEYDGRTSVVAARRIYKKEGKLAILAGPVGSGKTLGIGLAIAARGGLFVKAFDLDPFGRDADDLINACLETPLLGLDDVGAGRSASDVARARVEQIVCARYDAGMQSMLSTNKTEANFYPLYGGLNGRIHDRCKEDKIGWVTCLEKSSRGAVVAHNEKAEK